jgi:coenzyme Q-binding protein COQ10
MIKHSQHRTFPFSQDDVYELVSDVENYPTFLPGWKHVTIKDRKDDVLMVEQGIGYSKFEWDFMSKAELSPPDRLTIVSQEEPFKHLLIDWQLKSKGAKKTDVGFTIEMQMRSVILQGVIKRVIGEPIKHLLEVFEERAHEVYGK